MWRRTPCGVWLWWWWEIGTPADQQENIDPCSARLGVKQGEQVEGGGAILMHSYRGGFLAVGKKQTSCYALSYYRSGIGKYFPFPYHTVQYLVVWWCAGAFFLSDRC